MINKGEEYDGYIIKYDPVGNILWARSIGGTKYDRITSIATDDNDNIVIAGSFTSFSLELDTTTIKNTRTNPDSLSSGDLFLAKYTTDGRIIWATSVKGNDYENVLGLTLSKNNDIYITGVFDSPTVSLGNATLVNKGNFDIFLAKYNSDGNVVWAKTVRGTEYEFAKSIGSDANGNLYVTGFFKSPTLIIGADTLTNTDGEDIFIAKSDSNGNMLWAKSIVGKGDDRGNSLAVDKSGSIYVTGFFHDSIQIGTTILKNSSGGFSTIFIAKYDTNGNVLWAKSSDGNKDELSGEDISVDAGNNIYMTGAFVSSTVTFETKTLNLNGATEIFMVKYNSDGEMILAESVGGSGMDFSTNVITDGIGNIYLTGNFDSPSINIGGNTINKIGGFDAFIAKYGFRTTSVLEKANNYINIFPNPTASQFHISKLEPGNWTITIYTLDGESVFKKEITEANATIDLSGKAKGAYVYQLLKDGEVFKSGKIVVE